MFATHRTAVITTCQQVRSVWPPDPDSISPRRVVGKQACRKKTRTGTLVFGHANARRAILPSRPRKRGQHLISGEMVLSILNQYWSAGAGLLRLRVNVFPVGW